MKFLVTLTLLVSLVFAFQVQHIDTSKTHSIKFIGSQLENKIYQNCEIISQEDDAIHRVANHEDEKYKKSNTVIVERMPQFMEHEKTYKTDDVVEIFGADKNAVNMKLLSLCSKVFKTVVEKKDSNVQDEVTKLTYSGPSDNRIDVVFMGDGYTIAEKQKHLTHMKRLESDMFRQATFKPYLPLFNTWAVYRPSIESGIGVGGRSKNTAFRLYRQGTQLRGIYPGNTAAARSACRATGAKACDFPTIIGNDPYYGGLGGEFAISTESVTSGTVVLRHEFGHNFGRVGEEYDAGYYFGANHAKNIRDAEDRWKKWLSAPAKAQNSANRINAYPWYDLAKGPLQIRFTSDGNFKRWFLRFSISGCETQDSCEISIDGTPLPWKSQKLKDRSFYEFYGKEGFSRGNHILKFEQKTRPSGHIRQVCNVGLNEYKNDDEYQWKNDYINAYPLYNGNRRSGYRSQNEHCLMRNMTSIDFCEVCKENMWLQFFRKINCIDEVKIEKQDDAKVKVEAIFVKIGQFREDGAIDGEKFEIKWFKDSKEQTELANKYKWKLKEADAIGSWKIEAIYLSKEIRDDRTKASHFSRTFRISK